MKIIRVENVQNSPFIEIKISDENSTDRIKINREHSIKEKEYLVDEDTLGKYILNKRIKTITKSITPLHGMNSRIDIKLLCVDDSGIHSTITLFKSELTQSKYTTTDFVNNTYIL